MGLDDNIIDEVDPKPLNQFIVHRVENDVKKLKNWRNDLDAEDGLDHLITMLRHRKFTPRQLKDNLHDPEKHRYLDTG